MTTLHQDEAQVYPGAKPKTNGSAKAAACWALNDCTAADAALAYAAEHGWRIFPAEFDGKIKKSYKSAAHSNGERWGQTKNPDVIRRDFARWSDAIGVPTGIDNGIFIVETDTVAGHGVDGDAALKQLEAKHGKLPPTLMAESPTGSVHRYLKHPGSGTRIITRSIAPGVDVKGDGGMVIAPPSLRPGVGKYRWLNDLPIANPSDGWIALVKEIDTRQSSGDPEADVDLVKAAVAEIENCDLDWDDWNRIGMAIYAATGGSEEGREIFHALSAKSKKNNVGKTDAKWEAYHGSPPTDIGFGTLSFLADEACPGWRDKCDAKIAADLEAARTSASTRAWEKELGVTDAMVEEYAERLKAKFDFPKPQPQQVDAADPVAEESPKPKLVLTLAEWAARDLPLPDCLCGHWLTTTSRSLLYAPTGLGKTLLAVGAGMATANSSNFLHWRGRRAARVLYIDGEMSRRLLKQRLADESRRLGAAPETFFALSKEDLPNLEPLNTRAGQLGIEAVIRERCDGRVDLIIFDNIMALVAGDQKDEEGWRQTLPWVRNLTHRAIGQIWIHHTGHDTSHSYGTKTREWQMDTVIALEKIENPATDVSFRLSFTKARERTPATRADFEDVTVAILGDRWTWASTSGRPQQKLSPVGTTFYQVLCQTCDKEVLGHPAATIEAWREGCYRSGLIERAPERAASSRALFSKYKLELISRNWIACNDTMAWTIGPNTEGIL
jgi:Bifunctional DNA primase/polymerase, N-terminal/AAA domain/Primase C terminal 2 (PriCT-2)